MLACATSAASFNAWRTQDDLPLPWNEALDSKHSTQLLTPAKPSRPGMGPWHIGNAGSFSILPMSMTCSNMIYQTWSEGGFKESPCWTFIVEHSMGISFLSPTRSNATQTTNQTNKQTSKQAINQTNKQPTKQTSKQANKQPCTLIMWTACLSSLLYELNCSHCMLMELETPASAGAGSLSGGALGGSCRTVQMHTLKMFETYRNVVKKPCRTWYLYTVSNYTTNIEACRSMWKIADTFLWTKWPSKRRGHNHQSILQSCTCWHHRSTVWCLWFMFSTFSEVLWLFS